MAYRQSNALVRLVILAVILLVGWKYGVPWLKQQALGGGAARPASGSPGADCVSAADDAVGVWSRGVIRFMNPPVDSAAWNEFRSEVERTIGRARSECACATEACGKAREVVSDLDRVLREMDAAARSGGPPPSDLVRAQEAIDLKIEEAWKLADLGK